MTLFLVLVFLGFVLVGHDFFLAALLLNLTSHRCAIYRWRANLGIAFAADQDYLIEGHCCAFFCIELLDVKRFADFGLILLTASFDNCVHLVHLLFARGHFPLSTRQARRYALMPTIVRLQMRGDKYNGLIVSKIQHWRKLRQENFLTADYPANPA